MCPPASAAAVSAQNYYGTPAVYGGAYGRVGAYGGAYGRMSAPARVAYPAAAPVAAPMTFPAAPAPVAVADPLDKLLPLMLMRKNKSNDDTLIMLMMNGGEGVYDSMLPYLMLTKKDGTDSPTEDGDTDPLLLMMLMGQMGTGGPAVGMDLMMPFLMKKSGSIGSGSDDDLLMMMMLMNGVGF